jgi:glucuronate isomerase
LADAGGDAHEDICDYFIDHGSHASDAAHERRQMGIA